MQNLLSRLLALIVVAILSRILDRAAFGGVALALTIITFIELFVNQGFGEFITQRPNLLDEHLDTAFWANIAIGFLLAAATAIAATPLAATLDEPSVGPLIRWLALSLVIRSFSVVPHALLVRKLEFRLLSMRMIAAGLVGGVAGISAAFAGLGVYSLVVQFLVGDVVAVAVLWRATDWRPGRRLSVAALKQLSAFGTPVIGATMLSFFSRRIDPMIVGPVLGLAALGAYSMALRVFQITVQVVNKSTTDVTFSALSRLSESPERKRHAFYRVIELTAVLCFPTYVGLSVVAESLTLALFGEQWVTSAPVLELFALSGVPFSLSLVHLAALKSAGNTRAVFWSNLTLLVVYLPLMLLLVHHGTVAAAAASLIASIAIVPVEIMLLRAALELDLGEYGKALVGGVVATAVMAGTTKLPLLLGFGAAHPVVELVATILGGALIYVIALRTLAPATFKRCFDLAVSVVRKTPAP